MSSIMCLKLGRTVVKKHGFLCFMVKGNKKCCFVFVLLLFLLFLGGGFQPYLETNPPTAPGCFASRGGLGVWPSCVWIHPSGSRSLRWSWSGNCCGSVTLPQRRPTEATSERPTNARDRRAGPAPSWVWFGHFKHLIHFEGFWRP